MPNIATALKSEISRIARKEVRAETAPIKKSSVAHRSDIASLKKRVQALEQQLRRLDKVSTTARPAAEVASSQTPTRFGAKGLKAMRRRLGLSANDLGLLIGASSQSVYNWEVGTARPQAKYLAAIAFVKAKSKTEVLRRLGELKA